MTSNTTASAKTAEGSAAGDTRPGVSRLFVTAVDDSFDPDRDQALGPWCFIGHETDSHEVEDQTYPYLFDTAEQLYDAAKIAQRLAREIADRLSEDLNQRHGVAYSKQYWRYMTVPWLIHLVQLTMSYHAYIEKFVAQFGERDFTCTITPDDFKISFSDTQAFLHLGVREAKFGAWVSSLVLRELAPANWKLEPTLSLIPSVNTVRTGIIAPRNQAGAGAAFRRIFPRLRVDNVASTKLSRLALHLWLSMLPFAGRAPLPGPAAGPGEVHRNEVPDSLMRVLDQLVTTTLPATLGEGFAALDRAASRIPYRPGRLFVGSLSLYDDSQRIVAARAEEAGEKIVPSQHGGSYGLCKIHPDVFELEYGRGRFLTWGWTEHENEQENCRFYPVPDPGLSKVRDSHKRTNDMLVFTGCRITSVPWRLCAIPRAAQWVDYRRDKLSFFDTLDEGVLGNVRYRPYLKDEEDLSDSGYVRKRYPKLDLLRGRLEPHLQSCRLFVLDYPGSTLNFSMAANIPTVCFWNADAWPESFQGKAFFDRFRALGVLHDSPEAAAKHINEIWGDVDTWWRSRDVQAARKEFCRYYARTSRIWWWHWLKTLTRIHFER